MAMRFADKIALVTGGTSGIGLATARRLAGEGATVVIAAVDKPGLDAAVEELGARALPVHCDVANLADLDAMAAAVRDRYGRLDVVFANAGVASFESLADVTEDDFDRVMDINVKGVFFTIQKTVPLMPDGSAIVLSASWTLHRGMSAASIYSASKAAVGSLARTLAAELGPKGIRVNSVSPGYIATPMFHAHIDPKDHADILAKVVSNRFGTAEDVADAVAFLASDQASYINGQDVVIDGGLVATTPA